jgi:hypothetical protein
MSEASGSDAATLTGDALVAAHRDVTRKLRLLSIAFPLVFIAVLLMSLTGIVNTVKNVDTEAVAAELSNQAHILWPEIQRELEDVADEALPAVKAAIESESASMAPVLEQRFSEEFDQMRTAAERQFRGIVDGSLAEIRERQIRILEQEYPELAADRMARDKVLAASQIALEQWALAEFETAIDEHLVAIESIHRTLQANYRAPEESAAAPEDALMTWLELLNQRLGGASLLDQADATERPKGK